MGPIDLIFGAYMALLGILALGAWVAGEAGPAALAVFAGFYAVNAAFSLVSRGSGDRLRIGRARMVAGKSTTDGTLIASSRNITERKQAEEKLRASETHLQLMLENAFDVTSVTDMNGLFTYVSPNYETELGWKPEELLGQSFMPLIHPDDLPATADAFQRIVSSRGAVVRLECRARHKDGSWCWIEAVGQAQPDGAVVSKARNITERKNAEEALRGLNAELEQRVQERTAALESSLSESRRLAAIIEATSDYVGIADLEGRSLYVNGAGLGMVGKSAECPRSPSPSPALTGGRSTGPESA